MIRKTSVSNVVERLVYLGLVLDRDFRVTQDESDFNIESSVDIPDDATLIAVTQAQIDTANAIRYRTAAKAILSEVKSESAILRAFMMLVLDELNAHTAKINAILTAIDGAASLAGLKTAVAAITDLPTRTANQLRTAIENKVDAGDADA